ncbi:MAG: hypothetical protein MHM6MM_003043 [Cercozoa sp. M6MM]
MKASYVARSARRGVRCLAAETHYTAHSGTQFPLESLEPPAEEKAEIERLTALAKQANTKRVRWSHKYNVWPHTETARPLSPHNPPPKPMPKWMLELDKREMQLFLRKIPRFSENPDRYEKILELFPTMTSFIHKREHFLGLKRLYGEKLDFKDRKALQRAFYRWCYELRLLKNHGCPRMFVRIDGAITHTPGRGDVPLNAYEWHHFMRFMLAHACVRAGKPNPFEGEFDMKRTILQRARGKADTVADEFGLEGEVDLGEIENLDIDFELESALTRDMAGAGAGDELSGTL